MDIEKELQALHRNLMSVTSNYYVSQKQIGVLIYLMLQGLPDRKDRGLRIAVLRAWIGKPMHEMYNVDVMSTKNISGPIASFLIDLLRKSGTDEYVLSKYGCQLIEATAKYVQPTLITTQGIKQSNEAHSEVPTRIQA